MNSREARSVRRNTGRRCLAAHSRSCDFCMRGF